MNGKHEITWNTVQSFTHGHAFAEVSASDGHQTRYSYRVSWIEGDRKGAWFPDRGISFGDDILEAIAMAESWILEQLAKQTADAEAKLSTKKEKEAHKRKAHNDNFERRREENRQRTQMTKGKKG